MAYRGQYVPFLETRQFLEIDHNESQKYILLWCDRSVTRSVKSYCATFTDDKLTRKVLFDKLTRKVLFDCTYQIYMCNRKEPTFYIYAHTQLPIILINNHDWNVLVLRDASAIL